MPDIPAVCERCGRAFPSGIFVEDVRGLTLAGNIAGPCPYCAAQGKAAMGRVIEGEFNVLDGTIQALKATPWTIANLRRLGLLLEVAKSSDLSADVLASRIESEVPGAEPIASLLRRPNIDLKWWVMFVLAVLAIVIPHLDADQNASSSQIQQAIEQAIVAVHDSPGDARPGLSDPGTVSGEQGVPGTSSQVPGRNDPCWCGSGIKFKRCHDR